jgi:hypothetical protein
MSSSPGPPCGQILSTAILQVPLIVSVRTCAEIVQRKEQKRHTSPFGMLVDRSEEHLSHSRNQRLVSFVKKKCCTRRWLPKSLLKACHHMIHLLPLCCLLHTHILATKFSSVELSKAEIAWTVLRLGAGWTVRGSNPDRGETFCTRPDRPRSPPPPQPSVQ